MSAGAKPPGPVLSCLAASGGWSGSAEAWRSYQAGRDPLLEILLVIAGLLLVAGVLLATHRLDQRFRRKK